MLWNLDRTARSGKPLIAARMCRVLMACWSQHNECNTGAPRRAGFTGILVEGRCILYAFLNSERLCASVFDSLVRNKVTEVESFVPKNFLSNLETDSVLEEWPVIDEGVIFSILAAAI